MEDEPNESYRPRPKPEMRLYEEDEYELWILCREKANGPAPVTIEVDESKSVWQDPDAYRFYLVSRFFHTLEGFYKGYLDLTGRHQERCIALLSCHSMFMKDMVRVREIAREVRYEDEDWDGTMKTFVTYEMTDQGIWNNFRLKWKIPRSISFGWLEDSISQLYDTIRHSGGQPKIQCLCLSKLPPEIIDYIFSFASLDDARLLAATSKQMKAIARPYVFHRRTLCFRLNGGDLAKTISMDETQKEIYLAQLAVEMRQKLCLSIEFLLSRSDLTDALQSLVLTDIWRLHSSISGRPLPSTMDKVFYLPIQQCLCQVLQVCKNLTHLTISQFILSADWLIALSHLPALRSVMIGSVSIEDLSVESMIRAGEIPPCSQILTLEIMEPKHEQSRESAGLGIWHLLLILPSLVTLNHTSMRFISTFPDGLIREQTGTLFCTLRRLLFSKVNPWDVPDLINWIESRPNHICTLTHVKLEMVWGLPDDIAIAFVESLELAPLQVLSLEGLKTGSLEFIDRIAQLFPDLLGLTLIRRENDRQHKTTMCHWPHPSWEYAIHFRPFRKLRYFGWNFAIPMFAQTAIPLLAYEKIAEGMDPDKLWLDEELWKMLQEDCFHDEQYLAAPFAVHCPTLEVMVLDHGYHPFFCLVSRGERGEISLESEFLSTAGWDLKDWNPRLDLGWSSPAL